MVEICRVCSSPVIHSHMGTVCPSCGWRPADPHLANEVRTDAPSEGPVRMRDATAQDRGTYVAPPIAGAAARGVYYPPPVADASARGTWQPPPVAGPAARGLSPDEQRVPAQRPAPSPPTEARVAPPPPAPPSPPATPPADARGAAFDKLRSFVAGDSPSSASAVATVGVLEQIAAVDPTVRPVAEGVVALWEFTRSPKARELGEAIGNIVRGFAGLS